MGSRGHHILASLWFDTVWRACSFAQGLQTSCKYAYPISSTIPHYLTLYMAAPDWDGLTLAARDFIQSCLTVDSRSRPTAADCLKHRWLGGPKNPRLVLQPGHPLLVPDSASSRMRKQFDPKRSCTSRFHKISEMY